MRWFLTRFLPVCLFTFALTPSVALWARSAFAQENPVRRADALVEQGTAAMARGDVDTATSFFRQAVLAAPKNLSARTYLGILADQAGNLAEAERQFAAAVAIAPASPETHNNYGGILLKLGRKKQAAFQFAASLRLNSKQAGALVNLAHLRAESGTDQDLREARDLFQRAESLAPDLEVSRALVLVCLRLKDTLGATSAYTEYAGLVGSAPTSPTASATARAEVGAALLEHQLTKQAVEELQAAVQADPSDPDRVALLARAYRENKQVADALSVLQRAVDRGLSSAPLYFELGQTQEASGDIEKAIPAMHRAVQLDSKNEAYRFRYGMMLTDTKAPGAAVIRLQEALKEFPDSPRLWFALGFAQYQYTKYQDAAKSFQRALQLQPTMAASLAYLGIVNVALDNVPQAIEYYQRALQIEDHLAVLDYLTAEAYLKLSPPNDAQAEAHLKRALKLDPKLSQARVDLGKLYFGSGRLPEAAAELESAAQADPSMAEVYYQLGRVYKRMKRIDDAKLMFAKFEKLRTQEKRQSEDQTQEVVRRLADVRF